MGWHGSCQGALQNVSAQMWALPPASLMRLLLWFLTGCLHWSCALCNTEQGIAGKALCKHWKVVSILTFQFTSLPPSSWDCWICLQDSGSLEQHLCVLSTATDLSSFSQDLCSGKDKLEHLPGPRAKVHDWLLCVIVKVKAGWRAASDMRVAGVKLWSLGLRYHCMCWQWQTVWVSRRTNIAWELQPGSRANRGRWSWWEGYAAASELPLLEDCDR